MYSLMNFNDLVKPEVLNQPVYVPGKPLNIVANEYGLDINSIDKLASNENSFGPSKRALKAMKSALENVHLYPDGSCEELKKTLSKKFNYEKNQIIIGNGSNEIIELLGHLFLKPGVDVIVGSYSFIVYRLVAKLFGANIIDVPMDNFKHDLGAMLASITPNTRIVFVASPNNPTGIANTESEIRNFIEKMPDHILLCFDEAYAEYLENAPNLLPLINSGKKIICLRTFSKIYGLGGVRIGYAYGHSDLISLLERVRQPFNVNSLAQIGAIESLKDEKHVQFCRSENFKEKRRLVEELNRLGKEVWVGDANFLFIKVGDGQKVFKELQTRGVIVRPLNNYELPQFIRVTIGNFRQNNKFLDAMEDI